MANEPWELKGELVLSCNCTVFCPCVLSLGQHPPTEGYCQTWAAVRIDDGHFGDVDLSGVKVGLVMEIPGLMSRGNWTAGLIVDDRASIYQTKALTRIFTGKAGGTTALLSILVGRFLGVYRAPISYALDGETRRVSIENYVEGALTPVAGKADGEAVVISNSQYWIAPDITVCKADRSKMRAFGRNWNFAGRSAELCRLDWRGP
tara:strand:+ start:388 stop:1002 length:615 start_codon:yes stop_codon:yes gene_type:complete